MAEEKITSKERGLFTLDKLGSATKCNVLSGTGTFALTEKVKT
jgi:hypothetical protein